jgi:hypothetical protein
MPPLSLSDISPGGGDNSHPFSDFLPPWGECPKSLPRFNGGEGGPEIEETC